jgi:hypothetical protein
MRLFRFHREVRQGRPNIDNAPITSTCVLKFDNPLGRLTLIDRSEIDLAGIEDNIATDVARHVQLDLRVPGPIENYGNRGTPSAREASRVVPRNDGTLLATFDRTLLDTWFCATAG